MQIPYNRYADIDVSAPGVNIYTTTIGITGNSTYGVAPIGTSFAAPQVTALVAQILDFWKRDFRYSRPDLDEIVSYVRGGADLGGNQPNDVIEYGYLDAYKSVVRYLSDEEQMRTRVLLVGYDNFNEVIFNESYTADFPISNQDVYVLTGSTLIVPAGSTISNSKIYVLGDIFLGTGPGTVTLDNSEVFCQPGAGPNCANIRGRLDLVNNSCIVANPETTVSLASGATLNMSSGGFVVGTGGTFTLGDNASLTAESSAGVAAMTISPGTTIRMGANAQITMRLPVNWTGTFDAPIRFERLTPTARWGSITLLADGKLTAVPVEPVAGYWIVPASLSSAGHPLRVAPGTTIALELVMDSSAG